MRALILVTGVALAALVAACDDTPEVTYNEQTNTVVCNDNENCVYPDRPNSPDNRVLNKGENRP